MLITKSGCEEQVLFEVLMLSIQSMVGKWLPARSSRELFAVVENSHALINHGLLEEDDL